MQPEIFLDGRVVLHCGDCLAVLDAMEANSVDAVATDPPYHFDTIVKRFGGKGAAKAQHGTDGLFARASAGFMGKQWDGGDIAFRPETWEKVKRVLKPGGHLAAFSAPKCVHKMGFAIELAGFEVRDRIPFLFDPDEQVVAFLESLTAAQADALFRLIDQFGSLGEAFWTFGTGFPKSHDVERAVATRTCKQKGRHFASTLPSEGKRKPNDHICPTTPEAEQWKGWGTALKPAYEPIVIARKPITESSVARQVLKTGTGGINVGACEIEANGRPARETTGDIAGGETFRKGGGGGSKAVGETDKGRFPANLTHDGSEAATAGFPTSDGAASPVTANAKSHTGQYGIYGAYNRVASNSITGDTGSAARFFYTAKADAHDRIGSGHPTVKPLDLMQWLCRMLCPKGGTILDPFAGTGTTGEAAYREGMNAILIEREAEYQADIRRRLENASAGPLARKRAGIEAKQKRGGSSKTKPGDGLMADMFAEN